MEYKFYKVTEGDFVDAVTNAVKVRESAIKKLKDFEKSIGAIDSSVYLSGDVAAFRFKDNPDKKLWKKVSCGFMPKVSTKEGKNLTNSIRSLPKVASIQNCLEILGLNNMMVLGDSTSRGVRMHSASFCGKHDSKTYFIKIPQEKGSKPKKLPRELVECKEWEVLKFMES